MEDIRNLFDALKLATERTEVIKREIETKDTGDAALDDLQTRLQAAQKDEETTKETIFLQMAELSAKPAEKDPSAADQPIQNPTQRQKYTPKLPEIRQYKHGDNFLSWQSRFLRFLKIGNITLDDNTVELVLQNVDDATADKLEPVVDKMTPDQRRDPEQFFSLLKRAIYPDAELRGWRQELASGAVQQDEEEDVDTFAARIRSLAKKAYSEPAERTEPSLNAFLNGLRDDDIYSMVISSPGTDADFEKAVEAARNFEKRRRTKKSASNSATSSLDILRIESSQGPPRGPADSPRRDAVSAPIPNYNRRETENGPTHQSETRTCWLCKHVGHLKRDCPDFNHLNSGRVGNHFTGPRNFPRYDPRSYRSQ